MDTGLKIKQIRQEHQMTQNEFATSIGLSRSALTQLEAGHTRPSYDVLEKLIDHYDVDVNLFFNSAALPAGKTFDNTEELGNKVQKIRQFYDEHYGLRYNDLLLEDLVKKVVDQYPDRAKAEKFRQAYEVYEMMHNINRVLELRLVDPLKRYAHKARKLRAQEGRSEEDEILKYDSAELQAHLDSIIDETVTYMEDSEGVLEKCIQEIKEISDVDEVFFTSPLAKFLYSSQEEFLHHFEILLKNADALPEVEHYYETQHHFFGKL